MSLLKKLGKGLKKAVKGIGKVAKKALPIAGAILPGPVGMAAGLAGGLLSSGSRAQQAALPPAVQAAALPASFMPLEGPVMPGAGVLLPTAGQVPRVASGVLRGAAAGAKAIVPRGAKLTPFGTLARVGRTAAKAAGWVAVGAYWYDAVTGQLMGARTSRRMNPLNHRALRRAITRVKGAKKICAEVERITGSSTRRRRAAPACPPRRC